MCLSSEPSKVAPFHDRILFKRVGRGVTGLFTFLTTGVTYSFIELFSTLCAIARVAKPRQKVLKKRLGLGTGWFDGLSWRIGSVTSAAGSSAVLDVARFLDSIIIKPESVVESAWIPAELLEFSFTSTKGMTCCSDGWQAKLCCSIE